MAPPTTALDPHRCDAMYARDVIETNFPTNGDAECIETQVIDGVRGCCVVDSFREPGDTANAHEALLAVCDD